jgi:ribonucleoside-diphosphate reductase alpha chain
MQSIQAPANIPASAAQLMDTLMSSGPHTGADSAAHATVLTRSGATERFDAAKYGTWLRTVGSALPGVDLAALAHTVSRQVHKGKGDGTRAMADVQRIASDEAQKLVAMHPDWGLLSGRILAWILQREVPNTFSGAVRVAAQRGVAYNAAFLKAVSTSATVLDAIIHPARDFEFDGFAMHMLTQSYLVRVPGGEDVLETPQYMYMRVALATYGEDTLRVAQLYHALSEHRLTMATPTLFNAGMRVQQLSSCVLMSTREDSIDGIFDTAKDMARHSQRAAGIGLAVSNLRGKGSRIGQAGRSGGIKKFVQVFNSVALAVNQEGRRPGSVAIYIEPWHVDVLDVLELRLPTGHTADRARDLFYALWIPDEFMRRVNADESWTLMSSGDFAAHEPKLDEVWGAEFDALYAGYEARIRAAPEKYAGNRVVSARKMWARILEINFETGMPYILYKDAANRTSNQNHLGTIRSSNLCSEIVEYTNKDQDALCNLASIALRKFVEGAVYNHEALWDTAYQTARALDAIIDVMTYSTAGGAKTNAAYRPIGMGVQGLADVFVMLGLPYDSAAAEALNKEIFATMYHAAITASVDLSAERGAALGTGGTSGAFDTFERCAMARGQLQFDMWAELNASEGWTPSPRYDWDALRVRVTTHGLRNSLSIALMPTASTSSIMGNAECFAPYNANVYIKNTQVGSFVVWNKHLVRRLEGAGLWTDAVRNYLLSNDGTVQGCPGVDAQTQTLFRTAWELKNRAIVDLAAGRARYVCHSQSMNMYAPPNVPGNHMVRALNLALQYAHTRGLPTGKYYLHSKAASPAQVVPISPVSTVGSADCVTPVCTRIRAAGAALEECVACSA